MNMNKFLLVFIVCLISQLFYSQNITIPNGNFKSALVNSICVDTNGDGTLDDDVDTNNDGEIQVSEAEAVNNLNVSSKSISSLTGIEYFVNIQSLNISSNSISSMDISSLTELESIDCSHNALTDINISNLTKLKSLILGRNWFTSLNINSNSVEYLNSTSSPYLTNLDVSLMPNLKNLRCNFNKLTSLDVSSLNYLEVLQCSNNELTSLIIGNLPFLKEIAMTSNELTSIPLENLPNLESLWCDFNNLETLDVSKLNSLTTLHCSGNELTSLIPSPSIKELMCYNNNLTSLDLSNVEEIEILNCHSNNLKSLFLKNGGDDTTSNNGDFTIQFSGNPSLEYICADDFEISTIQYLLDLFGYTNCEVNTYCSFTPGGQSYAIEGQNFLNQNGGDCDDAVSFNSYIKYSVSSNDFNGMFVSNNTGSFQTSVSEGSYTITPILETPDYFSVSPASFTASFPTDENTFNQNFCITPNGIHNDLEISILPINRARPGFDTNYKIVYKNKGNQTLSGSIELNFQDDLMDLISSNPLTNTQATNLLTWNYNNLLPTESKEILLTFNINTPLETPSVNDGDILSLSADIYPKINDETEADNTFTLNQTVVNSYDPNDKTCLEGNTITPDLIGEYVHYLIRCENTGTAEAVNVVIKDIIDTTKFDINSLIITDSSHSMETRINSNIVEFIFENINLPFDDANNDGYVAFKIKTLPTLAVGDVFENDAEIYFDYNSPIITNKFQTNIENTLGLNKLGGFNHILKIYPNPAENHVFIESQEPIKSLSIYDISGRLITINSYLKSKLSINISINNLLSGTYFLKVKTEQNEFVNQIIKK